MKKQYFIIAALLLFPAVMLASSSGSIDNNNKYAWSENGGWVNFSPTNGGVSVSDSGLSGYAWSQNYGWINMSPTHAGVRNDGTGRLSGHAWGENVGWIDFSGVLIDGEGVFSGSATNDVLGHVSFDCSHCSVTTDYRPQASRPQCDNATDDDGDGKIDYPADPGCSSISDNKESDDPSNGPVAPAPSVFVPILTTSVPDVVVSAVLPILSSGTGALGTTIGNIGSAGMEVVESLWSGALSYVKVLPKVVLTFASGLGKKVPPPPARLSAEELANLIPQKAPVAFRGTWNLIPYRATAFALAPLPGEFMRLANKFPVLEETLRQVGVTKVTDVQKLRSVALRLPGLSESAGILSTRVSFGNLSLPAGVPLAKLSVEAKQKIPSEIVFAKSGGQLIDYGISLTVGDKGDAQQMIETIVGKQLTLVVKPDKPVKSVKGYVVFKSKKPRVVASPVLNNLTASVLFSDPSFAREAEPINSKEELVLLQFDYTDPDGDGIYTADIEAPVVDGEYEVITVMDYLDPHLAMREIRLVTVVDPEGYIYEKIEDKELRVSGAIATLYWLNPATNKYEVWPASEYQQENPQTTDVRGTYSFLVPEGYYSLTVEAPGYEVYSGKPFQVKEGSPIHTNIEMRSTHLPIGAVDWKTILLVVVIILLVYNFYKDKVREKLQK